MTTMVDADRLAIDPAREVERISGFLRRQLARRPRRAGLVVGLSGGVDSAVTAALACLAAGPQRTLGVLLPERESQPDSKLLAHDLAAQLGIGTVTEDLTAALTGLGVYERREAIVRSLFPDFEPGWPYRMVLPGDLRRRRELNFHYLEVHEPDGSRRRCRLPLDAYRGLQAATNVKQRLRMMRLYEHAERLAYLVAGTTNRSEMEQGFFVRYGDGGVDLEPLAHLYKTQVYELARHLGLPEAIIRRPPSPDTFSVAVSDADFFFRLPYEILDRVLVCLEAGEPAELAARETGLSREDAERALQEVARREQASRRLRELPPQLAPEAPAGGLP